MSHSQLTESRAKRAGTLNGAESLSSRPRVDTCLPLTSFAVATDWRVGFWSGERLSQFASGNDRDATWL